MRLGMRFNGGMLECKAVYFMTDGFPFCSACTHPEKSNDQFHSAKKEIVEANESVPSTSPSLSSLLLCELM